MQFNFVRTFSFPCLHSFSMFLFPGESNPDHTAYAVGIPHSSFVIMRFYYLQSSLPFVACPLPSSQRRQPGSSIVNASWRHDSTSEFSSASTAVPSSFHNLLQTFAFRWPSTVWDPMAHHKCFPNPTKPLSAPPPSFPSRCVKPLRII